MHTSTHDRATCIHMVGSYSCFTLEDIHKFVGLLSIKSSPCASDSFLNTQCCSQCPNAVIYYGGSWKTSSGPLFQTNISSLHLWSKIYDHGYIVSFRLFDYSRVLYFTSQNSRFGNYFLYTTVTTISTNNFTVMIHYHPDVHVILLSDRSFVLVCTL